MKDKRYLWSLVGVCLLVLLCVTLLTVPLPVSAHHPTNTQREGVPPSASPPVKGAVQEATASGRVRVPLPPQEVIGRWEAARYQSAALPATPSSATQSTCQILVVDDDWNYGSPNNGGLPYYTSALDALGISYDIWDTESPLGDSPTYSDMVGYDVVLWFTGYAWELGVFTPGDEAEVAQYLESGGQFILSSEDYYGEHWPPSVFMPDYLGVDLDSVVEDVLITSLAGLAGSPIGDGLGPYTLVRPDDWDVYWPDIPHAPLDDQVGALPGASSPFRYDDPENAETNSTSYEAFPLADEHDSTGELARHSSETYQEPMFRTVFLAWPFEWVDTVEQRSEILAAILVWMDCLSQMSLSPPHTDGSGPPGAGVPYTLTLTNDLGWTETFAIGYESPWPTEGPAAIGPVPDGSSISFVVTVTVPEDAACYETSQSVVTATAQSDPAFTDSALLETEVEPPGLGGLDGTVADANTSLGIVDAQVRLELGDHVYETLTDIEGAYSFPLLPSCAYRGLYSAPGYSPAGVILTIPVGVTLTHDVDLQAPLPALSHDAVSVSVPDGSVHTFGLVLTNGGTADLSFHITETAGTAVAVRSASPHRSADTEPACWLARRSGIPSPATLAGSGILGNEIPSDVRCDERVRASQVVPAASGTNPDIPWLVVQPINGLVEPGDHQDVELAFDTAGLDWGEHYTASLRFEFNDPYVMQALIPITLTVECVEANALAISGPDELHTDQVGLYSVTWDPITATEPVEIIWSNGMTGTMAEFSWSAPDVYTIVVSGTACTQPEPLTASFNVTVTLSGKVYLPLVIRDG